MSAHDIRNMINLLEAIEQGQKPELPTVVAVPRAQLDQLAGALKKGLETLNKKDLDEAGWRNKLAGAALAAAALGGGAGTADAQSFQSQQKAQQQAQQQQSQQRAQTHQQAQQAQQQSQQAKEAAFARVPLNSLRQCMAVSSVLGDRLSKMGQHDDARDLGKVTVESRNAILKAVTNGVAPEMRPMAVNMEMQLFGDLLRTYNMMPMQSLIDQTKTCLQDLARAGVK